jgi:D-xylose transport system permease protein
VTTTESTTTVVAPEDERATFSGIVRSYVVKIRGGDVGALPAILGLLFLVIAFSITADNFTKPANFANLINQTAGVTVIAMGLVFVLLLGEIDLSAGYTGGTAAAVLGVVSTDHGWPTIPSILACLATGAVIGTCIGLLVARLGIPSFVVTLAAFLGLQGVMLAIIGEGGTIGYHDEFILSLNNDQLPVWLGWTLAVLGLVAYAGLTFRTNRVRKSRGLAHEPTLLWAIKVVGLTVIVLGVVYYLSIERSRFPEVRSLKGVPIVLVVIVGLLVILTFMLTKTAWGRHVYAVGGNAEAARRAGINVPRIKLTCFIMCSTMAAIGGLLIASRDNSVSTATGGSETLLYAVGAAVIGGTSLFGGKGRVSDAIIGGLVIAVISNGMILLDQPAGTVYMVTGGVLLLAASVDAISRRRTSATGRA